MGGIDIVMNKKTGVTGLTYLKHCYEPQKKLKFRYE